MVNDEQVRREYESRFAALEAAQRQSSQLMETMLITMLSDRQIPRAIEEMREMLRSSLAENTHQVFATNAAQLASIEQLILTHIGTPNQSPITPKTDLAVNGASACSGPEKVA
ncbi:MAG: hypothetical protein ACLPWF_20995 [Bryobacteraceae bacterium]